jgi:hypothetical protein
MEAHRRQIERDTRAVRAGLAPDSEPRGRAVTATRTGSARASRSQPVLGRRSGDRTSAGRVQSLPRVRDRIHARSPR